MAKQNILRRILAAMLCVCLLVVAVPTSSSTVEAASLSELEQRMADLQAQQSTANAKLSELEAQIAATESSIAEQETIQAQLQEEMDILAEQISIINSKINVYNQQIREKTIELEETEEKQAEAYELFKQRVRAMYLAGETSTLEVLLTATSFSDLLTRSENIERITRHDQELVATLEQYMQEIADAKAAIESAKAEIEAEKVELDAKMADYDAAYEESAAISAELEEDLEEDEAAHEEMVAAEAEMEEEVQAAIAAYQAEVAAQAAAAAAAAAASSSSSSSTTTGNTTAATGSVSSSGYMWPVPDYHTISSYFGYRTGSSIMSSYHKGIDIPTGHKTMQRVVASKSGTVILAKYSSSYGNYIIIDHGTDSSGNSYQTLYAHNAALYVSVGDYVTQGQVIAGSGSTGNSTGVHCHFEVRVNGTAVNPLNYVSP